MKISDLYSEVLSYLLSIKIQNKNKAYEPTGSIKSGTTLKNFSTTHKYCATQNRWTSSTSKTFSHNIYTSESIGSNYLKAASESMITEDWNNFKNSYISKMLNENETITISSMIMFVYLVRCFVSAKFTMFTDVYYSKQVWLYNTSDNVDYQVDSKISVTKLTDKYGDSNLTSIMSSLIDEVLKRRSTHILGTSIKSPA